MLASAFTTGESMPSRLPEPDADELAHAARVLTMLRELITARGPLPFAQYMERCLYAPGLGYYSAGRIKFGADGDFVTAPELGGIFARCVVHALQPTLAALGADPHAVLAHAFSWSAPAGPPSVRRASAISCSNSCERSMSMPSSRWP